MRHADSRSHCAELHRRHRSKGQILIVFAIGASALVLIAGLVVDAGNAFLHRRIGQNASDLAALAGTKIIADFYVTDGGTPAAAITDGPKVYNAVNALAAANSCSNSGGIQCTWTAFYVDKSEAVTGSVTSTGAIPANTQGVIVHVSNQVPTFFLGVIGQSRWTVVTDATALTAHNTTAPPAALLPIAVNPPQGQQANQLYVITSGSTYGPGNFAWLSWNGSNATNILVASLCNPDNPPLYPPPGPPPQSVVPGDPGVTNSINVRDCLDQWIGATVLIPVFSGCSPCNGNNARYYYVGYEAFVLTGYTTSGGAINSLSGYFQTYSPLTSVPAGSGNGPPQPGDLNISLGLVR
jgi:Flp pilus assembly protein TadG